VDKPSFSPHFWRNLATHNPLGRRDITEQDARDWFDLTWPKYEQSRPRVRKPNHKLRVASWWIRISTAEIDRARALGLEKRRGKQADKLTHIAEKAFPSQRTPLRADLPKLRISRGRDDG